MSEKQKHKRLSAVLKDAARVEFNNDDRIVFFSDLHRGNNSSADEFAHNQIIFSYALQHYYDAGFQYVEVGDGDELLKFKHFKAIRLAHAHIYEMLQKFHQEGRFHFIFGNHDNDYRNPEVLASKLNHRFSGAEGEIEEVLFEGFEIHEGLVFSHQESGVDLFAVHGHQGEFLNDQAIWLSRFLLRMLWRPLQLLGFEDPTSVSGNVLKRQKIEQQLLNWVVKTKQPMICGHTHQERFPKKKDPPYFNTGSCIHPRWISCLEIKNGKIALVRWGIKPKKKGALYVKREVVRGPKNINQFGQNRNSLSSPVEDPFQSNLQTSV